MKELLTLATVTLLSTATAAYAGEKVNKDFEAANAKAAPAAMSSLKSSTRLTALSARMADHKLADFKDAGVKPVETAMTDAPVPAERPGDKPPMTPLTASTQTLDASKDLDDAMAKNDKPFASENVDAAAYRDGYIPVAGQPKAEGEWMPASYALDAATVPALGSPDLKLAKPVIEAKKPIGLDVASPFGVVSNSELATMDASGTAMGGPLDPAEFVSQGWTPQDADADDDLRVSADELTAFVATA